MLIGHGPNKAFLVPDSLERQKGTVTVLALTSQMTPLKTIRTMLVSAIFRQFDSYLDFLILQDKNNMHTLSLNIKLICTHCKAS